MKIAYQTNEQGFLIGEIQLQPNPRAEGEYLVPRNAVLVAPNVPKEGCVQVWDGTQWKYLEVIKKTATPPRTNPYWGANTLSTGRGSSRVLSI